MGEPYKYDPYKSELCSGTQMLPFPLVSKQ